MRGCRCRKLLYILFVFSVFSLGMMCGFYYEAVTSNTNAVGLRVAPETRNVIMDNGVGGHLREPLNLKQQIHPVHPVHPEEVAAKKVIAKADSFADNNKKQSNIVESVNKVHGEVEQQPAAVSNVKVEAPQSAHTDHHADINRKGFDAPIRLQPTVKYGDPPAMPKTSQINVNKPLQQPPVPVENKRPVDKMVKHQAVHKEVHPPAVNVQQSAKANLPQHQQLPPPVRDVHPPAPNKEFQQPAPQGNIKKTVANPGNDIAPKVEGKMVLSVVICGDRTDEALVMLKSAAVMTPDPLHFHIFAEDQLQENIAGRIKSWPASYNSRISFDIHDISFPPGENFQEWKKMFKQCATQRLFLPDLLTDTDALLYVDTDILFIKPLQYIWSFFKKFNSTQLAAMTPEHEVTSIGWYNRFARHPYHGATGLNSGVMLMNLTRMRAFRWSEKILPIYREYKTKITWGDQDLLNILFHFHPQLVYVYSCEWNLRPDHCMYSLNCHSITKEGVAVIHGNRGVYHNDKQRPFRIIYEAFRDFPFGADLNSGLIQPLRQRFLQQDVANMYCTKALQSPVIETLQRSIHLP